MTEQRPNIFELAEEEKLKRQWRVERALCDGAPQGFHRAERVLIASQLYAAKYDGNDYEQVEKMTHEAILENFCWNVFGASLDEVIKAYDTFLG